MSKELKAWFTVDELNAWADKKLKENPQWAEQSAQQITEAQVEAALKAACMHSTPESRKDMRRAIEAAHGIKENT